LDDPKLPLQRCRILAMRFSDDLSGAEIPYGNGETVVFSADDTCCGVHLTAKNASVLRKALRQYIEAGRPLEGSRRCPRRTRIGADTQPRSTSRRHNPGHDAAPGDLPIDESG
jgi:hypothetical protein